jgi:phosphatidylserine/phosphatidylglycerophosphate/cardiolipin synthase-like enzyme
VLLQTPYLVLSEDAQEMFRGMQRARPAPRVTISTNSLASTDAFIVYALSYKYKRRYLREVRLPHLRVQALPGAAPIDLQAIAAGAEGRSQARRTARRCRRRGTPQEATAASSRAKAWRRATSAAAAVAPTRRCRWSAPACASACMPKSIVVDERIGVVGTHNFDPRGDNYNTESMVVIEDPAFARALAESIRGDMQPVNAWVIAPRDKSPVFPGIDYSLGKVSESLPLFDLWPWRYATSYDFVHGPDCPAPLPRDDPNFRRCYTPVGDFPEVSLGLKA